MILNVKNLTHGFGDRAIFDNVSFRLLKGEHIGLIGANGEGKSTFMNIITGKLTPDEGTVEWAKNVRVGYLDQHSVLEKGMTIGDVLRSAFQFLFAMEAEMNRMYEQMGDATPEEMERLLAETGTYQELLEQHDFYMIDTKVDEIARALGLEELGLDRDVTDLSGGQRTRVLMAKLLLEKPDILLLDEPTNYLDEQHIEWLKRYLQDYENAFILISHDIPFLNSVINLIYHMENCRLDRYPGDYDKFQEVYAMKKAQLEAAYNRQQQEISDLKDFVARNKARVATRNMAMARQKKLDKMDIIELDREKPKPEFHFKTARTSGKMIFETNDLVIGYDEPLTKPLNIRMERGERIALTGANGIGKTTLLKSILQLIKPYSGEEDYYREKKQESLEMLQIFWDNGKSFNEADSVRYLFRNGKIQTEFELPENTTMLRLDPGEMSKGLKIVKLTWEDESQVKFHTDGCEVSSGEFYFGGDDPQIIVDSVPENRKSIKIEMEILDRKTTEKKFWKVYAEQKRAMEQMSQELAQKKALVDQVEGSKAWKVYRAIKRV